MGSNRPTLSEQLVYEFKAAFKESGLTQAEFSRRAGVSAKHLNLFLNGKAGATESMLDFWAFSLGKQWEVRLRDW